ncbi:MAG: hypothetical protein MZV63_53900 [Marinilabiliales bacterium]|nr:hypothetical protein [Marinilabiliales bacterium]
MRMRAVATEKSNRGGRIIILEKRKSLAEIHFPDDKTQCDDNSEIDQQKEKREVIPESAILLPQLQT